MGHERALSGRNERRRTRPRGCVRRCFGRRTIRVLSQPAEIQQLPRLSLRAQAAAAKPFEQEITEETEAMKQVGLANLRAISVCSVASSRLRVVDQRHRTEGSQVSKAEGAKLRKAGHQKTAALDPF